MKFQQNLLSWLFRDFYGLHGMDEEGGRSGSSRWGTWGADKNKEDLKRMKLNA